MLRLASCGEHFISFLRKFSSVVTCIIFFMNQDNFKDYLDLNNYHWMVPEAKHNLQ